MIEKAFKAYVVMRYGIESTIDDSPVFHDLYIGVFLSQWQLGSIKTWRVHP